ncbi:MAG: rhomboid family intramembrane serine protease [Microbacterium enclense]
MAQQRASETPAQKKAERRWSSSRPAVVVSSRRPVATLAIIAVTGLAYIIGIIPGVGPILDNALPFYGPYLVPQFGSFEPWRLLTVSLVHSGFFHVGLNMLALWFIGRNLEPLLGRWRFVVLYVLGTIGGSVAVALLAPLTPVVGASGAIFALFGALLVIGRHIGADIRVIAVLIGINFAWPFVVALISSIGTGDFVGALNNVGISWQAHLGGLITGAVVGLVYARTRLARQKPLQIGLLTAVTVALLALLVVPVVVYY